MAQPALEDVRELAEWRPPLGVLSVYLRFDPADRSGSWRTRLRNDLDSALEEVRDAEHARRMAVRAAVERLAERFDDEEPRPPPRGEAGFVEVSEKSGVERWWGSALAPEALASVVMSEAPVVAPLVDLRNRAEECGIALVSAERVRLLRSGEGRLEQLVDWELSVTSLDWRERKSPSTPDSAQGVSSSGHDQYGERLEHNRRRFIEESAGLAANRLRERQLAEVVVFGPPAEADAFAARLSSAPVQVEIGGEADLVSMPLADLIEPVAATVARLANERDHSLVERALGQTAGRPGATGLGETMAALPEGRVEHLVFDAAVGDPAEALTRGALATSARISVVRGEPAELLGPAGGVAAILRY